MSKKRGREKRDVDVELIEIYEDLANENEDIRLKAAQRLLSRNAVGNEDLLSTFCRLLRGLCSGRKAARIGFSVALVEFLAKYGSNDALASGDPSLVREDIPRLICEQSVMSKDASAQEKRDIYLGRLFAIEAVLKSRILFSTNQLWIFERLVELTFNLAKEKSWIREECGWTLLQALHILRGNHLGHVYAQVLLDKLHASGLVKSIEGVSLWITVRDNFTKVKLPDAVFKHGDPLYRKEKSNLVRILKEDDELEPGDEGTKQSKSKGWSSSKLHFGWEVVLSSSLKEDSKRVPFTNLWMEGVEDGLFAAAASDNKKIRGFSLVQRYIASIPVDKVDSTLGKNFCRCLVNQLAQKDRKLHAHARRALKAIEGRAASDAQVAVVILQMLLSTHGYVNFDRLTKTKTIENLIRTLTLSTVRSVIEVLGSILVDPDTNDTDLASSKRQTAADLLLHLVRSIPIPPTSEELRLYRDLMGITLEVFTTLGCFKAVSKPPFPKPDLSEKTRNVLQSRLISCLTHLMAKDPEPAYHPYFVVLVLLDGKSFTNLSTLVPDSMSFHIVKQARNDLSTMHNHTTSASSSDKAGLKVFECLFSMAIIQACLGETDAVSILEELQDCYQSIYNEDFTQTPTSSSSQFVEIILSLISKPSALFRRLAQQAFKTFAASIDKDGIDSLCRVLQARESLAGQDDLFNRDSEDTVSDSDRDSGSDGSASDVEEIEPEASLSERSSDGVEDGNSTDGDDEETVAFEKKLAEALGTQRIDVNAPVEEDESSDKDMNDEQMVALDPLMTTMFRERKKAKVVNRKKESKDAKENIVQFKLRVLELVQTYLKHEFHKPIALVLILPLLSLIKDTSNQDVSHKAGETVREFFKVYKWKIGENVSTTEALKIAREVLPQVHDMAMSGGSNAFVSTCSQASLLLVKVILGNQGSIEEAWAVYSGTAQKNLKNQKSKIMTSFFADWWGWCASARQAQQL